MASTPEHPSDNKAWRLSPPQTLHGFRRKTKSSFLPTPPSQPAFTPWDNSSKHFNFSIWYYKLPRNITTTVWTANKHDSPLSTNASLVITATRELRLTDSSSRSNLWPGAPNATNNSTRLVLNEDGNLVYDKWESFHFPTDTFLPNQSINGTELVSQNGKFRFLNSSVLSFNYPDNYWTSDKVFEQLNSDGSVNQGNGVSIISADYGVARMRRLTLDNDGNLRVYSHDESLGQWFIAWQALQESCRAHGICGPNAICLTDSSNSMSCVCPPGFRRSSTSADACERKRKLTSNTKFLQLDYVNFTGGSNQTNLKVRNLTDCRANCLDRPNCLGFMFKYDGQGYCVLQLDRLLYGYWSPGTEVAMFLRVDSSETDETNFTGMSRVLDTTCPVRVTLPFPPRESNTTTRNIAIICTLFAAELIAGILFFWAFLKKYIKYRDMAQTLGLEFLPAGGPKRFTYAELKAATDDFSDAIGKGGFRNFEAQDSSVDSEEWYFPRWAFDKVFKEMRVEDILDRQIKHCYDDRVHFDMVDRMVKTALWCLQDRADMRPSMGKVAKMLEGSVEITEPKKPTIFFLED
ncbi:hypothetical protein OIU85_024436 [Salix viminalis]|uniref:non-specific serine/threonine protein kinase n=1 Tax=Salix viminalis TaxID=40686 RepID=A0A9Q0Z4T4_SALVM|nr:hypothetical protein OIU85_024436 [Salix viminalis]